jgi:hypothetical protein
MNINIMPGSDRTFFEALRKAGLPEPTSWPGPALNREIGNLFLTLLIIGIDHEVVGAPWWVKRILGAAPRARRGPSRPEINP